MKEEKNEKKIRWNISKAMACVYQALDESKLRINKTKSYTTAMENLMVQDEWDFVCRRILK
ncbi:MAG: hypothetical protein IIT58_03680 [Treponema sp.]|nr:hypothetical protein [Treponema sp.]